MSPHATRDGGNQAVGRLPQGLRITTHLADVSDEAKLIRLRDEIAEQHETGKIHLLFKLAVQLSQTLGYFLNSECCLTAGPAGAEV